MATATKIILICALVYAIIIAVAFMVQRKLTYFPSTIHVLPHDIGLEGVEELTLDAPDGARVLAWYGRARPGQPTLLYFHGNGGNLAARSDRMRRYLQRGRGMLMLTYRGYSGSLGSPSEKANFADARLAYDRLIADGVAPADIILYGESLGSGIATRLATQVPVGGIILESPYTSIAEVGQSRYPFLPVRYLIQDRYEHLGCIGGIHAPLLVVHGQRDRVVPFEMGEAVFKAAPEPKEFLPLPRAGHNDHHLNGQFEAIASWIDRLRAGEFATRKASSLPPGAPCA